MSIFRILLLLGFIGISLSWIGDSNSQEIRHEHLQTVEDDELKNVVSIGGTRDGKFVYSCGFDPGALICFERDTETGKLTKRHSYPIPGLVTLDISEDQKYLATCSFQGNSLTLFSRNEESGALEKLSEVSQEDVELLHTPISVELSTDSKFAYLSCSSSKSLLVFSIIDGELEFLQAEEGIEDCLDGARFLATVPSEKSFYLASYLAGTISIFSRDEETGRVELQDHIMDDSIYAALLDGVHGLTVSPDGNDLYAVSGRFSGDDAVSVFRIQEDKTLKMTQEFENGVELDGFTGGNHIGVSPDGKMVYASGATSGNLACFERDLESGKLRFIQYLEIDGTSQLGMTAGIYVSQDSKFIYVGGEGDGKIYVFQRQVKKVDGE